MLRGFAHLLAQGLAELAVTSEDNNHDGGLKKID